MFGQSEYMSVHAHTPQGERRQLRLCVCVCVCARASVWQGQQLKRVQEKEEECGLPAQILPGYLPCVRQCSGLKEALVTNSQEGRGAQGSP